MQGKRVTLTENDLSLSPCEYGKNPVNDIWYCVTPNGHYGNLAGHDVIEHEDGTITVFPSILVSDDTGELWHGFLEHGIWRVA